MVPEDYIVANPATSQMVYGYSSDEPKKYFVLKKPFKSASLLKEALKSEFTRPLTNLFPAAEQANDPSTHKKAPTLNYTSTLPIRMRNNQRKLDNTREFYRFFPIPFHVQCQCAGSSR